MANQRVALKLKTQKGKAETKAVAFGRFLKVAPTKVRDLLDLIRGKNVIQAQAILQFSGRKGGREALRILKSALANAGNPQDPENWQVTEARADKGPIFKRSLDPKPRGARGLKTTNSSHIKIAVGSVQKEEKKKDAKKS